MKRKTFLDLEKLVRLYLILIATAVVLTLGAVGNTASANIITVTNTNDNGTGSLRHVITDANAGDDIVFDASLSGQTITLTTGQLIVDKDLTITGLGEDNLAVSGGKLSRVFKIEKSRDVTLSELMITDGFERAVSDRQGGGILNNGKLTINRCTISGNYSSQNDDLSMSISSIGGGIANTGELTINNSTISENGGIFDVGSGGGIYNSRSGKLTINNSTISGNRAHSFEAFGGGIDNYGMLIINNSTISGNISIHGGGISNQFDGKLTINNSTISRNSASFGEGILIGVPWEFDPINATVELQNTILAGNPASTTNTNSDCDNSRGKIISLGNNLIGNASGCNITLQNSDLTGEALLGPLADNGGPTFTHALLEGSLAIDAGSIEICPSTDQRNLQRPLDGNSDNIARCDIGSYEYGADKEIDIVNEYVTFNPLEETFKFSSDMSGCPSGFEGTFSFDATLVNMGAIPLSDLAVQVVELTEKNHLKNTNNGISRAGAVLNVDKTVNPNNSTDITFEICIKERMPFSFAVDVWTDVLP